MGFRKTSDGWFDFYISDDGEVKFRLEEGEDMSNIKGLAPGTHFMFTNYEWIVLDNNVDGGILAIMAVPWNHEEYSFSDSSYYRYGETHNYARSSLRKKLLDELLPILGENNLISHEIELIGPSEDRYYNKKTLNYGTGKDKVFILTIDEYRKYRKYIPVPFRYMWTCTPRFIWNDSYHDYVVGIAVNGSECALYPYNSYNVLPACVFNPEKLVAKRGMIYLEEKSDD